MSDFHLAHFNVARMRYDLDSPEMADFVGALEMINKLGESSPGFVWRFADEEEYGPPVSRPYAPDTIATCSVWESVEALYAYSYQTEHLDFLRRRREWFHHATEPMMVLWWIPAGRIPTLEEGVERLDLLRAEGPSPRAFTFRKPFEPA